MPESPLRGALHAVMRPLEFASQDGFAKAERVQNLENVVREACRTARELDIPTDIKERLDTVANLFGEPLAGEDRVAAVEKARSLLVDLAAADFEDELLARAPSCFSGVGPKRAAVLAKRGIETVLDLLFLLPLRYDDRRSLVRTADLEVGLRATFVARVKSAKTSRRRGRFGEMLEVVVGDEEGTVVLRWFRGVESLKTSLKEGVLLGVTGDVRRYRFSKQITHPEIDILGDAEEPEDTEAGLESLRRVVPAYPQLEGIPPRTLRRLVEAAVQQYADLVRGFLPPEFVQAEGLPAVSAALREIHFPDRDVDLECMDPVSSLAHRRLILEELFLLELGLGLRRSEHFSKPGVSVSLSGEAGSREGIALPFSPTPAQGRSWGEIRADLERSQPMSRLLQGDVGSGKTAVAFMAAAAVARAGYQAAFMAPTELLAEQHLRSLAKLAGHSLEGQGLRIALLTASLPAAEKEERKERLRAGEIDIVVGTHALLQDAVAFSGLALAVIDEQHRFGVMQRAALSSKGPKGRTPHVLVMTATPIPRTLALTLYGDLDVSVIDEMPPGRSPVETLLLRADEGRRVLDLVRATAGRGEQVYVVYPLVENSEKIDLRAATESARRIRAALPEFTVDLVHGRLEASARNEVMRRFEAGKTRVLVSTSVIEVGVDVPNATLMVVEHAERFGLAQLHQLRGRVGRGTQPGTCILVARGGGEDSEARIRALLDTQDGFRIADADLRIRGPGEFLGTAQHGSLPDLRIADLTRDVRLVSVARELALETVRRDSQLLDQPRLRLAVEERWGDRLALARVG